MQPAFDSLWARTLRALSWNKRPLRPLWTRAQRVFRFFPWRDCFAGNASAEGRSWVALHLEQLSERVAPGDATGGLVAVLVGVSVADPVATGLALLGQTPEAPLPGAHPQAVATAPAA